MTGLAFAQPNRVAQSMRALSTATGAAGSDRDQSFPYFEALNKVQVRRIRLDDIVQPPKAVFEFEDPDDRRIIEHFLEGEAVDDTHFFPAPTRERIEARLADGFAILAAFDRDAVELARSLIARILFASKRGFGGASTGDMLGCVWLSPPAQWEAVDYAEALHHESIHQALFLEEMVHGVYTVDAIELAQEKARVVSAIRREKRPFDASFHAACVAAALVDLYRALERPERVQRLLEGLRPSVEEMLHKDGYLTGGGRRILGELELRAS